MTLCLRFFECDLQPNNDVLKHRSIPSIRTIGNTITRVLARRRRKILRFLHLKSMISNRKFDYLTSKSPKFSPSAIFKNRKKKHLTPKTASFWDLTPDPRGGGFTSKFGFWHEKFTSYFGFWPPQITIWSPSLKTAIRLILKGSKPTLDLGTNERDS